jgi:hypothetical protein
MRERQEIEQYFFDAATLDDLARLAARFPNPCCLCTPSLGAELESREVKATTLDIDERFAHLRGFRRYDVLKPEALDDRFGIIVCDPPFLSITLPQLREVIQMLSHSNYRQPIVINYWVSKARAITSAFAPFGLQTTGYRPTYTSIQNTGRNAMQLYANLGPEYELKPPATVIRET